MSMCTYIKCTYTLCLNGFFNCVWEPRPPWCVGSIEFPTYLKFSITLLFLKKKFFLLSLGTSSKFIFRNFFNEWPENSFKNLWRHCYLNCGCHCINVDVWVSATTFKLKTLGISALCIMTPMAVFLVVCDPSMNELWVT